MTTFIQDKLLPELTRDAESYAAVKREATDPTDKLIAGVQAATYSYIIRRINAHAEEWKE